MNFGETLAYWYLRLNGFFPLSNFVLHRDEETIEHSADADLLAVRFPFVYEAVGGQPDDWDNDRFMRWGLLWTERLWGLLLKLKQGRITKSTGRISDGPSAGIAFRMEFIV